MDASKDHKRVSAKGIAMGQPLTLLADAGAAIVISEGDADERCKSCAFKAGTVPNGCLQTQMDALKCVVEDVPFMCHQPENKNWPCNGWFYAGIAIKDAESKGASPLQIKACPWEFSEADALED